MKPGTKKRAPAKPKLDLAAEDAAAEAAAAQAAAATAAATAGTTSPLQAEAGGGAVSPGPQPGTPAAGAQDAGAPSEVDILLGKVPNPDVVPAEPEPLQTASAPEPSADDLRGQTEIQVINQLGSPAATRADGTSTIWSYRGASDCALDVYFFLDVADNQRRALSYEFIPNRPDVGSQERCYRALKSAASQR